MFKNKRLFQKYSYFFKYRPITSPFDKWQVIKRDKKKFNLSTHLFKNNIILSNYQNSKFSYTYNAKVYTKNFILNNNDFLFEHTIQTPFKIIFLMQRYIYLKMRFYGKTFKWLFYYRKVRFKVQKAHRSYLLFKNLIIKRKKKLKLKFRLLRLKDKTKFLISLNNIKPINIFTKRGFRVLKSKLFKKQGKISTYV